MNKLKLMGEYEMYRTYQLNNGEEIKIILDDCGENITVKTMDNKKIGYFDLRDEEYLFFITHMFLDCLGDKYLKKGIGRECLKYHKEIFRLPIACSSQDEWQSKEDGSHLTGMALNFVAKMQAENLIEKNKY